MKDEKGQVKSTHDDSAAAGAVTPAGGTNLKRPADNKKQADKAETLAAKTEVSPAGKVRKEDLDLLFQGTELSEDFQDKAFVLFEGALSAKIEEIKTQLDEQFETNLTEAKEELEEKLSDYLDLFVEKYMTENEIAIENGIKSEIAESLINGMKDLVAEHNVEIPEDKIDIVETLTDRISELETELNETIEDAVKSKKLVEGFEKSKVLATITEDLDDVSKDKLSKLVEHISYETEEDFLKAANVLKENLTPTTKVEEDQLLNEVHVQDETSSNSRMSRYIEAAKKLV